MSSPISGAAADLHQTVVEACDEHGLWPAEGCGAVIACSAGLDSTVLARVLVPALRARGVAPISVATLHHGWRSDGSGDGDLQFVSQLATQLGVDFLMHHVSPDPRRQRAVGREAAAREQRLSWLDEVARSSGADCIYLAHHQDDQVETVLLRRLDGVPVERAAAMAWRRGRLCRPLLGVPRARVRATASVASWPWREDPTNDDLTLQRNRVRHVILPELRRQEPDIDERLLREGLTARAGRTYLSKRVSDLIAQVRREPSDGSIHLNRSLLTELSHEEALLLLRSQTQRTHPGDRPPSRAAAAAVLASASTPGWGRRHDLSGSCVARVQQDSVILEQRSGQGTSRQNEALAASASPDAAAMPAVELGSSQLAPQEAWAKLSEPGAGRAFAVFDPDALHGAPRLAAAGSGRRMHPFGMSGSRLVRDLLAEAGVPPERREAWPIVVDEADQVLWISGVRASAIASLRAESRSGLLLYTTRPSAQAAPGRRTPTS